MLGEVRAGLAALKLPTLPKLRRFPCVGRKHRNAKGGEKKFCGAGRFGVVEMQETPVK